MPALLTTGCLSTYLEAYCLERYAANHTEEVSQKIVCNPAVGRDGSNSENEGGKGMKYERRREERLKEEDRATYSERMRERWERERRRERKKI